MLEPEPRPLRIPGSLEWASAALCAVSFLVYLLHSRAADAYLALYVRLVEKLLAILGR